MRGLKTAEFTLIIAVISFVSLAQAQSLGTGLTPNSGMPSNVMSPKLKDVGIDQKLNSQVPLNLSFRDESGQPVTLGNYFNNRPVILSLVYFSCPMLCPRVVQGMAKTLNLVTLNMGKDYSVLTVSFDPKDTPGTAAERKREWLQALDKRNDRQAWHFLTGDPNAIAALTQSVGFRYNWDPESHMFAHATGIMVLTPEGKVSKYFYGTEYPPADLRLGLVDASHDKIGSAVDQILLFCCKYNAVSGKYDLLVSRVLAIGGGVTLIAIGAFLLILFRVAPKKKAADSQRTVA